MGFTVANPVRWACLPQISTFAHPSNPYPNSCVEMGVEVTHSVYNSLKSNAVNCSEFWGNVNIGTRIYSDRLLLHCENCASLRFFIPIPHTGVYRKKIRTYNSPSIVHKLLYTNESYRSCFTYYELVKLRICCTTENWAGEIPVSPVILDECLKD